MAKVYVGNLPLDVRERELEDLFYKFGKIKFIDIKTNVRPPGFAFVEFERERDAQDAVRVRDGYDFFGHRLRVELARGGTGLARERFQPPRPSGYRVLVKGLPKACSWQDLKDHIRQAARPNYVDVRRDPQSDSVVGIVEFETIEDMRLALRKLDDSEFNNPRYERGCYVRLIEDTPEARRDERSRGRSRSRSRSPVRRSSRSMSRSRSPADRERGRAGRARDDDSPVRGGNGRGSGGGRAARSMSRSRSRSRSRSPVSR